MTINVRTRFQPTRELEVDEQEAKALEHQGLLYAGTPDELAALHADAGLPAPSSSPAKPTPFAGAAAGATEKKEGA